MTIIDRAGHPRKPDWWLFQCDECKAMFWGPERAGRAHYCEGCRGTPHALHFVGNHHTQHTSIDDDPDAFRRAER